jgi:hypothetical protein
VQDGTSALAESAARTFLPCGDRRAASAGRLNIACVVLRETQQLRALKSDLPERAYDSAVTGQFAARRQGGNEVSAHPL